MPHFYASAKPGAEGAVSLTEGGNVGFRLASTANVLPMKILWPTRMNMRTMWLSIGGSAQPLNLVHCLHCALSQIVSGVCQRL